MGVKAVWLILMGLVLITSPADAGRRPGKGKVVVAIVTYHPIRTNLSSRSGFGQKTAFGKRPTTRLAATNDLKVFPKGCTVVVEAFKKDGRWHYSTPVSRTIGDRMGPRHRREARRKRNRVYRIDLYVPKGRIPKEIMRYSGNRCLVRVY